MIAKDEIFTPVISKRAFEEVSLKIKKLILEGVLGPGDKLPSEIELAKKFNVGRPTVREALRILELSGFIVIQQGYGGGPVVKNTVLNKISGLFMDAIQLGKISIEQLTTARMGIEKAMMESVVDNAGEQEIDDLQTNILKAWDRAEKGLTCIEENIEFHRLLAKASKNPMFVILIESIIAGYYDYHTRTPPDSDTCSKAIKDHEILLDAIRNKDRDKALELLDKHFQELKDRFQSLENK
jgi:DNA-binding FadR family transcriptional regulator